MSSERKVQILDMAERLFSERGYHATSMRDLARQLDLKGGSLYSHIRSKEELLWLILERAANEFLLAIRPFTSGDGSPESRLRAAICAHVRVITGNLDGATVYFHEWKFLGEPQRRLFLARRREYEQAMRALVVEAVASGEFHAVDPKWATILILSSVNWLYHWYDPTGPLSSDEIADRLINMLFQGLSQI
ncbi:MAG: TetR/AcrR family transcriptional regulator [Ardenticatenaceae bacterium]